MTAPLQPGWSARLQRAWWQPGRSVASTLLAPAAWAYRAVWMLRGQAYAWGWVPSRRLQVPVLVVGNLVVGGAGKSPLVIALLRWLREEGWHAGVISRGYRGQTDGITEVTATSRADEVGDEPVLIRRRGGVPVFVGRERPAVAAALLQAHPEVDLIVSDDGLQHLALQRDAELIVFDERGMGNGALLPAGPLREPLRRPRPPSLPVLYNAPRPSTTLRGALLGRRLGPARPLAQWHAGRDDADQALHALRGREIVAAAGIGHPQRFFDMLRDEGLTIKPLPLPDHHDYSDLPWPAGTRDVVVTEKDAVKIAGRAVGDTRVWVVGLDLQLPDELCAALRRLLPPPPAATETGR